jgi:hypothetical protein
MAPEGATDKSRSRPNGKPITLEALARAKQLPADFLRGLGLYDLPGAGVAIPYYDQAGEEIAVKKRTALKATGGSYWPRGQALASYGDWRIGLANKAAFLVLVEGESDCWALWHHGIPALGIPGANSVKVLTAEHVACVQKIYVHREPDQGGERFVAGVVARLKQLGFTGQAFEIRCPEGIKDPADLHVRFPDQAEFCRVFEEVIKASERLDLRGGAFPDSSDEPWEAPIPLGGIPEALDWPGDVLPEPVETFIRDVAFAKGCPPDYVALPVLVLAGAAVGTSRALEIKPGWRERACIYGAVIGPPGSAKTPALKTVALPVYLEQSRRLAQYKRDKQAWEGRDGDKGPAPKLHTVYVSDITVEKLACVLEDNSRGVALIRDELTGWVAGMDQYRSKGRGADRQAYLSIWAGEPIRVDRKNQGEPVYVAHPFLGIIGGLPPALLPQLRGERGLWDGFLDRVLTIYPEPLLARGEDWACVSDEAADSWKKVLAYLWGLQPAVSDYGEQPRVVYLSVCGRRAWERFTGRLAAELNRDDLPDPIKGHLAKAKGYGARLALIVHCLRLACGEDVAENVDGESVERAGRLTDYLYSHCRKVHVALGLDQDVEDARRVLEWVRRESARKFKRHQVFEDLKSKSRFPRIEDLDRPIDRLVKHNYLRLKPAVKKPGRPPHPVYEVNPAVYGGPDNPINPTNSKTDGKTGGLSDSAPPDNHPTKPEKLKGNGALSGLSGSSDGLAEYGGEEEPVGPWGDPL